MVLARAPKRALLSDANPHLIAFFQAVQDGDLTADSAREHLVRESDLLRRHGNEHFLRVRTRFNDAPTSLDLLFLNHTCFNGLMRFNAGGGFNTPFCKDPHRLSQSLVTTLAERVRVLQQLLDSRDWVFRCVDWRVALDAACAGDFTYLDPPYFGRHAGYFTSWPESEARELATAVAKLPCGWALSDWLMDSKGHHNHLLSELYESYSISPLSHRYVVGAAPQSRGALTEAVVTSRKAQAQ